MNDSSEKWVGQVTNLSYRFSLFQGVFNDDMNDFLLIFLRLLKKGRRRLRNRLKRRNERNHPKRLSVHFVFSVCSVTVFVTSRVDTSSISMSGAKITRRAES